MQTTSAWTEDSHSMHQPTISSEGATEAANVDHTNLCCYCFTRRADHLIIDCREFLPLSFPYSYFMDVFLSIVQYLFDVPFHPHEIRIERLLLHLHLVTCDLGPQLSVFGKRTERFDAVETSCVAEHLGPCLECAASKKIEYCGQLNCQTKVTRFLRLFR